ncbi:MAG TPA: hypothetical protein DEQ80_00955 [Anaerolinea thermolimosa]|uniref:Peptidase M28 domain-containing protein n=1 Tax=Anaerolinea thermolimosa TaxID=229919 RepID=A0A3D1JDA2_9CHLR|nr:hypothetical protein [Anaerolinea thermolimosa]
MTLPLAVIRYLAETIGGRGSCTPAVSRAGEYVHGVLRDLGTHEVRFEPFAGAASTYRPFMLAFLAAFAGSLLAFTGVGRLYLALGAVLNGLGAWAMLAEAEFAPHWAGWLIHHRPARNVCGVIRPAGTVTRRVVLCAHLDTHRTPVFYSSAGWQRLFGLLVAACLISMLAGTLVFAAGALLARVQLGWVGAGLLPFQGFALIMVAMADFTPFSPGANDNASGVGVILGLAGRLKEQPLRHTEVHLLFTDCEETGAWGMRAFLNQHARELGEDCLYVAIDQVGVGQLCYLLNDGLIFKHPTHPRALELARRARQSGGMKVKEIPGTAYTDALPATLRGRVALTLCTVPEGDAGASAHWHQMSDRFEVIDPQALAETEQFTWQVLQEVDGD